MVEHTKPPEDWLKPKAFKVRGSGVCSEYSISGWEGSLDLYLGEGARDYLPLILQAVNTWNQVLMGFNQKELIRVSGLRPRTYNLSQNFWESSRSESESNLDDGQSVIYFKGSGNSGKANSYAHYEWNDYSGRMVEADIYINTTHEELYGPNLARTVQMDRLDETYGVYAFASSTYLTILHELGHALGLNHVPVSGNIMSYNYMPRMIDIWRAPLALFYLQVFIAAESEPDPELFPFMARDGEISPYMIVRDPDMLSFLPVFTNSITLGEQDRMALLCIYDFEDWNH